MATLPDTHPLFKDIRAAKLRVPKKHPSPLHLVMNTSKLVKTNMETIPTAPRAPGWKPSILPTIAKTREDAIKADHDDKSDINIYTDGSGLDGKIGAAAILYHGIRPAKIARHHLGPSTKHTVFEGEGVGQLLGLQLLEAKAPTLGNKKTTVSIAVDNQASLRCHNRREQQPGAKIIEEIQATHDKIRRRHPNIEMKFRWIPGHEDIPRSDEVDKHAKIATKGQHKNKGAIKGILKKPLPTNKAAARQELNRKLKSRHNSECKKLPRFERMQDIDPSLPSSQFRKICRKLPRRNASLLMQLRVGHVPLQAYLHKFKLADSPTCQQCGRDPETVRHFLKHCPAYRNQRRELKRVLGHGKDVDVALLNDQHSIRNFFAFLKDTHRFDDTHGDVELPSPNENEGPREEQT